MAARQAEDVRFIGQIGSWLRYWRQRAKLSQKELAERCGLKRSTVARWEDPRNTNAPSLMNLIHIQRELGLYSIELLFGGPESFPSRKPTEPTEPPTAPSEP